VMGTSVEEDGRASKGTECTNEERAVHRMDALIRGGTSHPAITPLP
jgi:hypothetical protein